MKDFGRTMLAKGDEAEGGSSAQLTMEDFWQKPLDRTALTRYIH